MTKKRSKKQVALLIIFSLMLGLVTPVVTTDAARAAGVYGDTLSKLKKNTLSIGKKKTFTSTYKTYTKVFNKKNKLVKGGIYKKAKKIKVKHIIKVGKLESSGDNYKVTFNYTIQFKNNPKIQTKNEYDYFDTDEMYRVLWAPNCLYSVFDYKTGNCLEVKNNPKNVKVKTNKSKTKYYSKQYYTTIQVPKKKKWKNWIRNPKSSSVSFTVTYPKTYKDACVAIGSYLYDDIGEGFNHDYWNVDWSAEDDEDDGSLPWGATSYYKKGNIAYIRLLGDDTESDPTESVSPTADPSATPIFTPIVNTPSPTPETGSQIEKINKEIDDANKAYSEKWTTATRWKKYEETANAVLVDLSEYSKTYEVNFHNLPYTNSEGNAIFGDRYETFATNLNKAIGCITSDMMNISDTSKSKTFSNLSQLKLFLKTNVSNKSIKSAVTRGNASGDTVSVHLSLFLNHEADCEFKVKDISGLENDGTVIV